MVLERIADNNNLYPIKYQMNTFSKSHLNKPVRHITNYGDYKLDPRNMVITLLDTHAAVATDKIKATFQWALLEKPADAGAAVNFDNENLNIVITINLIVDTRYNSAFSAALNLLSWRAGVFGAYPEDILEPGVNVVNGDMWMSATGNQGFSSRPNLLKVFGLEIRLFKPQN